MIPLDPIILIANSIGIGYSRGNITLSLKLRDKYTGTEVEKIALLAVGSFSEKVTFVSSELVDNVYKIKVKMEEL